MVDNLKEKALVCVVGGLVIVETLKAIFEPEGIALVKNWLKKYEFELYVIRGLEWIIVPLDNAFTLVRLLLARVYPLTTIFNDPASGMVFFVVNCMLTVLMVLVCDGEKVIEQAERAAAVNPLTMLL